jgi:hypothetical protein
LGKLKNHVKQPKIKHKTSKIQKHQTLSL